ncbi:hypothetical protein HDV00_001611 [Rhizophlyctis rosea]|nr:hypothetical protein HDV00_001611 [Rhizophlyctis rosea]
MEPRHQVLVDVPSHLRGWTVHKIRDCKDSAYIKIEGHRTARGDTILERITKSYGLYRYKEEGDEIELRHPTDDNKVFEAGEEFATEWKSVPKTEPSRQYRIHNDGNPVDDSGDDDNEPQREFVSDN